MPKRNQTIDTIASIEQGLLSECGSLCMDDHQDRATMAWWIFKNFCAKDYHETITNKKIKNGPGGGGPFPGPEKI